MQLPWKKSSADIPRRRQLDRNQLREPKQAEKSGGTLFRRNRTLVGSLSASVSSASELNADLRSPRAHVHHLTAHRRRLGSIFVGVAIISGCLIWLIYEFTAGVHVSASESAVVLQQNRYQKAINDYLARHPAERLRPVMNESQLTAFLAEQVPEVASVHIDGAAGFATSQFTLTFRHPVASWLIGLTQYYVDKDGVSFSVNYFDQPTVKIVDQSGVQQSTGTPVASSRFLRFVGQTVNASRSYGLTIEQAIIPSGTTRQIELRVAGHGYPVKLSLDRPVGEQVEDMQRAIAYFDARQITPQYIDVRVSGKAFYR